MGFKVFKHVNDSLQHQNNALIIFHFNRSEEDFQNKTQFKASKCHSVS